MARGFLTETLINIMNIMARKSDRLQNSAAFWVLGVCGTFKERCSAVGTRTQVRILAKKK